MADVRQPAPFVVAPLFCRFVIHRAVRQAVCLIVMPVRDKLCIFAADELPGGAVVVTLRSAVKARFLRQPVQGIVDKVH
ncbi:hypothetical protein LVQ78_01980 [Buttiauxella sp. A2-C2_NF]|nr:hypothetical protein [Buttiauxella ferragutiae]MCE0824814.1 hypothetical protein [Buttiauxella ferragutiae]